MGLGAGPSFPALAVLLAAWVPQKETGKLGTLLFGGGQVCISVCFHVICYFFIQSIRFRLDHFYQSIYPAYYYLIGHGLGSSISGAVLHLFGLLHSYAFITRHF